MLRTPPRVRLFVFVALGLVLVAAAGWWFTRAPSALAVIVQPVPLVRTLQFSARVATASRVDVGATITGRVTQVTVAEGASVRRGEVLVRLETAELQAALDQARASEQQAVARLAGLRGSGRSTVQAGLAQADAVLVAAQAELGRTQDLVARGFLGQSRLDEAQRALQVAQAQQASARAQSAANAEQGTDVVQAQAQLALASSATQAARARLSQAELLAPTDARVLTRMVEPGQIVQPGRALLALAPAGPLQLVAPVDERYLQQLQAGQAASVRADAFPEQRFAAQVLSIAPQVDAQRAAVEVKFSVAQPPAFLREDMTLSVEVETARRERALVVPVAALRSDERAAGTNGPNGSIGGSRDSASATLWLEKQGRVEARSVQLGLRTLESVEVVQGLAAGDTVLVGQAPAPGSRVKADLTSLVRRVNKGAGDDAGSALSNAMGR